MNVDQFVALTASSLKIDWAIIPLLNQGGTCKIIRFLVTFKSDYPSFSQEIN